VTDSPGDTPDRERIERGSEVFEDVYQGVIDAPPAGLLDFADVMLGQLFAEHWSRPQLARRDRRLLTLATIAAVGDPDTWAIHLEAGMRNDEFTAVEAREMVLHLSQYVGYPRASPLLLKTEEIIGRVERDATATDETAVAAPTPNRLVTVVLEVADLERSARLYRDAFGLDLHLSDHEGGEHGSDDRWISGAHAALTWTDGAFLHFALYQATGEPTRGAQLSFRVDDIRLAHDRAVTAGAEVAHEPRAEPWGTSARYRDPDGNVIELTQPTT
jgi:4-carboxymuconolactone decarboxylase